MSDNNDSRLDDPIYLDYDVKKISKMTITHKIMLETIKGCFEKHGFKETEKKTEGITILKKSDKK